MLFIGSDHGAYKLKQILINELKVNSFEFEDCGCFSKDSVDYPEIAQATCKKILATPNSLGVLLCGTGIGISIAANKIKGIRAALCHNEYTAQMAREHNNANVLCLGGRVTGDEVAKGILHSFLQTNFAGERHQRRVGMIE